jgi:hypothetical protein
VAVPLLAIAGGAIGGSRALELKPGWAERPCIYAAVVGDPGSAKSPALKAVAAPVYARQARLKAKFDAETEAYERDLAAYEAATKERKNAGKKQNVPDDAPAEGPPARPKKPVLCRAYASDTTTEALAPVLASNPRGLTIIRDELTAWVAAMNQYKQGRGADRQLYLAAWGGEPWAVDRKSQNGVPIFVPHPFVCVVGCLPPGMIGALRESHQVADGFLDRILFSYPDPAPVAGHTEACLADAQSESWRVAVEFLSMLNMVSDGAGGLRPKLVRLTPDGLETWKRFLDAHAAEMNVPGFSDLLRGPWAKFRGHCGRLALILQLLRIVQRDGTEEDVGAESVRGAVRLTDYFKGHAAKVYHQLDANRRVADCRKVLTWAFNAKRKSFSKRDAHNALQGTFKTVDDLDPVLGLLTRHHYLRPAPAPEREGAGRKPSPVYEIHPAILATESTESTESRP